MKLMTYNILDGGEGRLDLIISAIKNDLPDVLVINEANNFVADDNKVLKKVAVETGLSHYAIAPTEWGYDVAIFSKSPLKKSEVLMPGKRAAISVEIDSEFGPLSVVGAHLSPDSGDMRLMESKTITDAQKKNRNRIIMGDMNALSRQDNYDSKIISGFNKKQLQKFTYNGKPRFDVTDAISKAGYHDASVHLKKNKETTVPTPSNKDIAHADLRLDYIFVSEPLASHLTDYKVVKNDTTDKASDHYPVIVTIQ